MLEATGSGAAADLRTCILSGLEHNLFHLVVDPIEHRRLIPRTSGQITVLGASPSQVDIDPTNLASAAVVEELINTERFELSNTPRPNPLSPHAILELALFFEHQHPCPLLCHCPGQARTAQPSAYNDDVVHGSPCLPETHSALRRYPALLHQETFFLCCLSVPINRRCSATFRTASHSKIA